MNNIKRLFIFVFPLIFLFSCVIKEKRETIDKLLLFGYMEFCYKDSITKEYDSTKLEIRQYFGYKRDSYARIQTRYGFNPTKYYTASSIDTLGFNDLINRVLVSRYFEKTYSMGTHEIYDGVSYTLYYKTSTGKENSINYRPHSLPDSLKILHNYILKLFSSNKLKKDKAFEFDGVTTKVAKEIFRKNPPLKILDTIKYTAPKVLSN